MGTETPKVIMTKEKVFKGKTYTISLTESDMEELRKGAVICKLNGHDCNYFLNQFLNWNYRENWADVAQSVYAKTKAELKVGLGATMNLWSDRRAMTIVKVITPRKIVVQENETKCIDYYAGDYEILDSLSENKHQHTFTLRKNGRWVEQGQANNYGSVTLTVGFRRHYIDPSF